jgi:hypothetical protein
LEGISTGSIDFFVSEVDKSKSKQQTTNNTVDNYGKQEAQGK